jgi:hypothetical protein
MDKAIVDNSLSPDVSPAVPPAVWRLLVGICVVIVQAQLQFV